MTPDGARAVVLFAHGSGSSRHSPRNRMVAGELRTAGLGTLLIDLLTEREERHDVRTAEHRFDIPLLGRRLVAAIDWLGEQAETKDLPVAVFGASTGAAAALQPGCFPRSATAKCWREQQQWCCGSPVSVTGDVLLCSAPPAPCSVILRTLYESHAREPIPERVGGVVVASGASRRVAARVRRSRPDAAQGLGKV